MNTGVQQVNPANPDDLPGILSTEDQRRAFGKAKRHTIAVKTLKFMMPLLSLGIIGLYFIPDGTKTISPSLPVSIEGINLDAKGLKMINPRYTGGNDKLGKYTIEAEYALQKITSTHLLELHKIAGLIEQPNKKWTKLKANKGTYDTNSELMVLQGDIEITSNQGMEARLQSAKIDMKKQLITTDEPVQMKLNENVINAVSMSLSTKHKSVLFSGGVKVKLLKNKSMSK
jgi:lipopolysaccharide export system protein LptC